jgi:hypothetical protein
MPPRDQPSPAADRSGGQHWESSPERPVEIVTVTIFDREYHFKSNRPNLVRDIAKLISRLHGEVRTSLPGLPHLTDHPAHVAFSLARDLIKCRRELEELKTDMAGLEERLDELAALLDRGLES